GPSLESAPWAVDHGGGAGSPVECDLTGHLGPGSSEDLLVGADPVVGEIGGAKTRLAESFAEVEDVAEAGIGRFVAAWARGANLRPERFDELHEVRVTKVFRDDAEPQLPE